MDKLLALLREYNVTDFEITDMYHGIDRKYKPLKRIIVYDRFVHIPNEFHALGYGLIHRSR